MTVVQCNFHVFALQHAKQSFTESEAILNGAFIFDSILKGCPVSSYDNQINMLELAEAPT